LPNVIPNTASDLVSPISRLAPVGSPADGLLFDAPFSGASIVLVTLLASVGVGLTLGLPRVLGSRNFGAVVRPS
jgi:hypothetical protein